VTCKSIKAIAALGILIATMVWPWASADAQERSPSVSVDVSQLDAQTYERLDALNLEKKVILRLVQEGFAVVAARERPYIRVVYRGGSTLRIEVESGVSKRTREVHLSVASDLAALHLEVAQKTVALVRQMPRKAASRPTETPSTQRATPAPAVGTPVVGTPAVRTPAVRTLAPVPRAAGNHPLTLDAVVGLVTRGKIDPLVGLNVSYAFHRSIGAAATFGFVPASSAEIDVFEGQVQLGVYWAALVGESWRLLLGVSAGVQVHCFSLSRESLSNESLPNESGTRVDPLVTSPLTLTRRLWKRFEVGIRLAPGLSGESREHTRNGVQLWQRSGLRLEASVQLSWRP